MHGRRKADALQIILNRMESTYAGSTIRQTYIAMGTMFKSAVMNDIIVKHPMNGVRYNKPVRAVDDIRYLSVEEQKRFLAVARILTTTGNMHCCWKPGCARVN